VSIEDIQAATGAKLLVGGDVKVMDL
jgi:hypothetical protein